MRTTAFALHVLDYHQAVARLAAASAIDPLLWEDALAELEDEGLVTISRDAAAPGGLWLSFRFPIPDLVSLLCLAIACSGVPLAALPALVAALQSAAPGREASHAC